MCKHVRVHEKRGEYTSIQLDKDAVVCTYSDAFLGHGLLSSKE